MNGILQNVIESKFYSNNDFYRLPIFLIVTNLFKKSLINIAKKLTILFIPDRDY